MFIVIKEGGQGRSVLCVWWCVKVQPHIVTVWRMPENALITLTKQQLKREDALAALKINVKVENGGAALRLAEAGQLRTLQTAKSKNQMHNDYTTVYQTLADLASAY